MVSEKKCPFCGVDGEKWKEQPKVFKCPNCNTVFNHFGVLLTGNKEKQDLS
jgi:ribosomal protein L37AE/L43A